jgi:Na+/H+ antiporter NhaD/arsenite permease-like protein
MSEPTTLPAIFGFSPMVVATAIFFITYAIVISEKINRAIVALMGAGLVIGLGVLTQEQAIAGIDFNTIGLLTGMMVLVSITQGSGVFQFLAVKAAKTAKGHPFGILIMLSAITAILSALLGNVTTVLLIAPVTLLIAQELKIDPYPFLFAEINASNTGGTATLIGDPPNIMIGSATGLTFNQFLLHLTPLAILAFMMTLIPLAILYRKKLVVLPDARSRLMKFNEWEAIKDWRLLKQSLSVFGLVLLGFFLHHTLQLEPATIALIGAALLLWLVTYRLNPEESAHKVHGFFSHVEWVTIFFFCGLFIVVAGIEHTGLLNKLAALTLERHRRKFCRHDDDHLVDISTGLGYCR